MIENGFESDSVGIKELRDYVSVGGDAQEGAKESNKHRWGRIIYLQPESGFAVEEQKGMERTMGHRSNAGGPRAAPSATLISS